MPKALPLKIHINKPCAENWADMDPQGKGRFCGNCKHIIVDFSQMSDQELLYYFQNNKNIHCGRFHNDQLNKYILPAPPKGFTWKYLYKAAATLFAFLSMKDAEAGMIKNKPAVEASPDFKKSPSYRPEKVIISGVVKNAYGEPLENAEVKFGEDLVIKTGKDGAFQFELSEEQATKSALLIITYPGMVQVVRNYHFLMQSTSYNITLSPPFKMADPIIMGGISTCEDIKTPDPFIRWTTELSMETKNLLAAWATTMRNHPEYPITITAFAKNKSQQKTIQKRADRVKKYFIEMEGIADERLLTKVEVNPDMGNFVQIDLTNQE